MLIMDDTFKTKKEAEKVLCDMQKTIDNYAYVSLADYYDLIGKLRYDYDAHKYGWVSIRESKVTGSRKTGWTIVLPNYNWRMG